MMQADVLWTPELLAEVVREVGYKAVISEDEDHDVWIDSKSGGAPWRIAMLGSSPLFRGAAMGLGVWVEDPFVFTNAWNAEKFSKATVIVDPDTDEMEQASDGTFLVIVNQRIEFHSGLTREYVTALVEGWVETVESIAMRDDIEVATAPR